MVLSNLSADSFINKQNKKPFSQKINIEDRDKPIILIEMAVFEL